MLLATGASDQIVYCVTPDTSADEMAIADHGVSTMLFNALEWASWLAGSAEGSLTCLIRREREGRADASQNDITGLVAAAGPADLRFEGSLLEQFMTAAFDGTVEPGCRVEVVNRSFKRWTFRHSFNHGLSESHLDYDPSEDGSYQLGWVYQSARQAL